MLGVPSVAWSPPRGPADRRRQWYGSRPARQHVRIVDAPLEHRVFLDHATAPWADERRADARWIPQLFGAVGVEIELSTAQPLAAAQLASARARLRQIAPAGRRYSPPTRHAVGVIALGRADARRAAGGSPPPRQQRRTAPASSCGIAVPSGTSRGSSAMAARTRRPSDGHRPLRGRAPMN